MKKIAGFVPFVFAAVFLVACGDDDSGFISRPDGKESSSSVAPKSSNSETSESSSSFPEGYVDPSTVVTGTMTDERDGQTYRTTKIGDQVWMAENLNYEVANSLCVLNNDSNCTKYGRLYAWGTAMDSAGVLSANGFRCGREMTCSPTYPVRGVCPEGWHLPDSTEWETLFTAVGGRTTAGLVLKSPSGWNDYEGGDNGSDAYAFSALPAGLTHNGVFGEEGKEAYFWSSTEADSTFAHGICMYNGHGEVSFGYGFALGDKYYRYSVRCVKD